jgi:hypothetical protein
LAINEYILSAKISIVLAIKNISNGVVRGLVIMAIEELLDFVWVRQEALETGDDGKITEYATRFQGCEISSAP